MVLRKSAVALTSFSFVLSSCAHPPTNSSVARTSYSEPEMQSEEIPGGNRAPSTSSASNTEETPWTTWSQKGEIGGLKVLRHIREYLLANSLHDPHVDYFGYGEPIDCSKTSYQFRSADGTCNYKEHPYVGAAGVAFGRNAAPQFIDQDAAKKVMTPNPDLVSKEFFTRDQFKPVPFLNMLAAVWIQFMNHDWLTHGRNSEESPYEVHGVDGRVRHVERTKALAIDPQQYNQQYKKGFDKISTNDTTHWWDASQIYGSSRKEQEALRKGRDGKMKTTVVNGREILPKVLDFNAANNKQNQGLEATGFRDNWWVGLSLLHTLFVEEHNSIAVMLKSKNAKYNKKSGKWAWKRWRTDKPLFLDDKQLDEQIFQTARLINAAVLAKIHTVEWTPAILPNPTLKKAMYINWYGLANPQTWSKVLKHIPGINKTDWFSGNKMDYVIGGIVGNKRNDAGVPFSITEEFTSVYRLHPLLPEQLDFKKLATSSSSVTSVPFVETIRDKSYEIMENNDLKDLFYSFGTQLPGQLVLNNFPKFMQNLEIPGGESIDLGMVDIIRDRERGVPRYNQFRRAIGLKPLSSYRDFFMSGQPLDERQSRIIDKFKRVYGTTADGKDNVEDIDLLVGTLAEDDKIRPKNFGFGETLFQIFILMASRRLMADRFFTDDYRKEIYTQSGLDWIDDESRFSQVIIRHMPELKPKVSELETAFLPWHQ